MRRTITLAVETETDEQFVTHYERIARLAAGLHLDGYEARVYAYDEDGEE